MKKNNLFGLMTISFMVLFRLSACAQDHRQNEQQLAALNKISNNTILLNNHNNIIPLLDLEKKTIASVNLGFGSQQVFDSLLNKYAKVASYSSADYQTQTTLNSLEDDLKYFNTVVVTIPSTATGDARNLGFIRSLTKNKQVIVCLLGEGRSLTAFDDLKAPLIWTDQNTPLAAMVLPQVIFGGIGVSKKLVASYSPKYIGGSGFTTVATRLKYTVPEDAGVNSNNLKEIDKIAEEAIRERATPGMVVLVAKDGKVIFNKAYGHHTYDKLQPNRLTDIFDLASMTKITATTMECMKLSDEGKLSMDSTLGSYVALARPTDKNSLTVRELLLHQAGLIPDIQTFGKVKPSDHSRDSSASFPTKVNENYYLRKNYFKEVMQPDMLNSPLRTRGKYVYSDVGMCLLQQIVETITSEPENLYVDEHFYKPLGMQTTGFLPLKRFSPDQIIPTENDKDRNALLDGYVHDPTAALMGGVAGHAGLFGNANDIAIIYQMMLNKGSYGGKEYIKRPTVELFTSKQSTISRRGLGFDRWDPDLTKTYPSALASPQTYGHTGYTGTCVWVDPVRGLVYIFLSNRVNPVVSEKLGTLKIRGRIQDAVNKAIDTGI
ncbi:serine hydrolase domain-containing protein [Pedobacter heparinus]|uniref:Beta-lactamase n=1 Tax=Pedobacter heparinus (strain ATCC 13125 / DSM 2366 / CIP 104194 / JCM 7457 / NBRC 12017 / NCIMB 9290 / NRRL B-14731 / HIM 762-3) TaxID=485917 RepID=C6Y008_PEDHD|nr:serine hydrolase [Pedobacter heparinus]ACU02703.1 beta-lactamase [Pedobacter heparinus DSM 2366]